MEMEMEMKNILKTFVRYIIGDLKIFTNYFPQEKSTFRKDRVNFLGRKHKNFLLPIWKMQI
jgi:hypothetical protein